MAAVDEHDDGRDRIGPWRAPLVRGEDLYRLMLAGPGRAGRWLVRALFRPAPRAALVRCWE